MPSRRAIWLNRSKVTSCSTSTSPPYGANCAYSTCRRSKPNPRRSVAKGAALGRRSKLADVGRQQSRPARLAVPRLFDQHHTRTEFENRCELGLFGDEGKELHVELLSDFTQQMVNAYCSAVRQGKREVGRQHGDTAAASGAGAAFNHTVASRDDGAIALGPGPPPAASATRGRG